MIYMTKNEANELAEVLKAWAEGQPIQCRKYKPEVGYLDWEDTTIIHSLDLPIKYRVKPKPMVTPYKNATEYIKAANEHGHYFRHNESEVYFAPATTVMNEAVYIPSHKKKTLTYDELAEKYLWFDGTPCGNVE